MEEIVSGRTFFAGARFFGFSSVSSSASSLAA
jgi:hypothetical protein